MRDWQFNAVMAAACALLGVGILLIGQQHFLGLGVTGAGVLAIVLLAFLDKDGPMGPDGVLYPLIFGGGE